MVRMRLSTEVVVALLLATTVWGQRLPGEPGEVNTPPARGERTMSPLREGDVAPDFTLRRHQGDERVTLSDFRGKRPVVLIFGSYT